MKVIVLLVVLAVAVSARPQFETMKKVVPILFLSDERDDRGQFSLGYTTGDGTTVTELGFLKPTPDGKDFVLAKKGSVMFTTPEGLQITQTYEADENGFRTMGDHLPKSVV